MATTDEYTKIDGEVLTIVIPNPTGEGPVAKITGNSFKYWPQTVQIGSASQKETPEGDAVTDLAKMFDVMVRVFAEDDATRGFIHDRKGALIPFAPDVLAKHAHDESVAYVALILGHAWYPSRFGPLLDFGAFDDVSAEGEDEAPEEEPTETTPETASPDA